MSLKILCAWCSPAEREGAESVVRRIVGARPSQETWTVSLVRLGAAWIVSVEAPGSLRQQEQALQDAIRGALGSADSRSRRSVPAPVTPVAAQVSATAAAVIQPSGPSQRSDSHRCPSCSRGYHVVYDARPGEASESVAVACPHCWRTARVDVAESAALTHEYRAERE